VLHGVGQHESLIWTKFLQRELGPAFRVINFAQRGGSSTDFGNIAAELLLRQSRPVIFVGYMLYRIGIPLKPFIYVVF
jgi:hypothetical protein